MYVLLDIGGTKTRIATTIDLETFSDPHVIYTPQNFEEGIDVLVKTIRTLIGDKKIKALACGIAASPNRTKTMIVGGGPNIADWLNKPLKQKLEDALRTTVYIENDTAMGGLAQVMYGPARGFEITAYVTVSTGVGGCRFVNGAIDKSAFGFEPGWQIIGIPELSTDEKGTREEWLNGYCSKGYLMSHIGGMCVAREERMPPYEITDEEFWNKKAQLLAYGLHNITTMWSPDVIVVGGSMMNKIGIPLIKTKEYLAEALDDVFPSTPKLFSAQFGDEMGLYGAMGYLKQKNYH